MKPIFSRTISVILFQTDNESILLIHSFLYRCKIPECDATNTDNRKIEFDQPWLAHVIPSSQDSLADCVRYAPNDNLTEIDQNACSANMFDASRLIECNEFIYSSDEINVQTEVSGGPHTSQAICGVLYLFCHF